MSVRGRKELADWGEGEMECLFRADKKKIIFLRNASRENWTEIIES